MKSEGWTFITDKITGMSMDYPLSTISSSDIDNVGSNEGPNESPNEIPNESPNESLSDVDTEDSDITLPITPRETSEIDEIFETFDQVSTKISEVKTSNNITPTLSHTESLINLKLLEEGLYLQHTMELTKKTYNQDYIPKQDREDTNLNIDIHNYSECEEEESILPLLDKLSNHRHKKPGWFLNKWFIMSASLMIMYFSFF